MNKLQLKKEKYIVKILNTWITKIKLYEIIKLPYKQTILTWPNSIIKKNKLTSAQNKRLVD